jgi:hypothetical protein
VVEQHMVSLQQLPGEEHWLRTSPSEEIKRNLQRARLKVRDGICVVAGL